MGRVKTTMQSSCSVSATRKVKYNRVHPMPCAYVPARRGAPAGPAAHCQQVRSWFWLRDAEGLRT